MKMKHIVPAIVVGVYLALGTIEHTNGPLVTHGPATTTDLPTGYKMAEYARLIQERNDTMYELIELIELKNLYLEGKLHSS